MGIYTEKVYTAIFMSSFIILARKNADVCERRITAITLKGWAISFLRFSSITKILFFEEETEIRDGARELLYCS